MSEEKTEGLMIDWMLKVLVNKPQCCYTCKNYLESGMCSQFGKSPPHHIAHSFVVGCGGYLREENPANAVPF